MKSLMGRRARGPLVVLAVVIAIIVPLALPGVANLAGSTFDAADGNLVVDGSETDWANVGISCTGSISGCDLDKPTGKTDDSFGQGTKESDAVPTVVDGSIPNNKSDLLRFYVSNEAVGTPTNNYLYLAWERVQEPNGTTNMDFEFNKSTTLSSNGVTPVRSNGDVLIMYDLSQGGLVPTLGYKVWNNGAWGATQSLAGSFEGSTNADPVTDPINPNAPRTLSPRTFGEAAINLTTSGILPSGTCEGFGRAYLKSRSSDAFTSELKDFIAPIPVNINNCGTVLIHKTGIGGAALNGAGFTLYTNNIPLAAPRGAEDTATSFTCTTAGNGDCSMANIPFGNYWAVETTVPPGYLAAPDQPVAITTGGQVVSLTFVDNPAPGTINIHKQDDDNPANPLQGAVFKLYNDLSPFGPASPGGGTQTAKGAEDTATALTCTTNSSGNCSIGSVPLGRYWVHEETTPAGHDPAPDQNVVIGLGSTSSGQTVNLTFTDPRNFKIIVIVCKEAGNTLYPSAVTIDGASAGNSLSTAQANTAGLSESALCGVTQGARGGRRYGNHASDPITIPQ